MTIILCTDDKNGMMFGKKRQSQDSAVIDRILAHADGKRLLMSSYSATLFDGHEVTADDDYAAMATADDVCFVEDGDVPLDKAGRLIIYRWNRRYPATRYFDINPIEHGFSFASSSDFAGSSHERITEEIYTR